jgi:hypothetical protein
MCKLWEAIMESIIAKNLQPDYEPGAVVRSKTIPVSLINFKLFSKYFGQVTFVGADPWTCPLQVTINSIHDDGLRLAGL